MLSFRLELAIGYPLKITLNIDPFMAIETEFKYDVAFSFCEEDEADATRLNDLLQDRLSTFLYSKKQEALAGTDGEETFSRVFAEEARVVVIFHRAKWGTTPWTRIEETAIRNRAFQKGYDFTLFIPREEPPKMPAWLPNTQLWYGWVRWGVNGAASVIEALVAKSGGKPRHESVLDRAARFHREQDYQQKRKLFSTSIAGVNAAKEAFEKLASGAQRLVSEIIGVTNLDVTLRRWDSRIAVLGFSVGMLIYWHCRYSNSLQDSKLEASLWNGHPPFPGIVNYDRPTSLSSRTFQFDLSPSNQHVWIENEKKDREYSSELLAEVLFKYMMDRSLLAELS